jgi:dolichol-phosphate mannosyltransferase
LKSYSIIDSKSTSIAREQNLLIIIVLAYNEERNIGTLLENISALGDELGVYRVIVVDDGSRDGTVGIVNSYGKRMPVSVVSHAVNQGVGAAFRTGFSAALAQAHSDDVIVTMEADNTGDLKILSEMVRRARSGDDVVLASCYAKGGQVEGTNFFRKFLSSCANLLLVVMFPIPGVRTYSSFYRAYNSDTLQRAIDAYAGKLIEQAGFVCMAEVLVKMHRLGVRISEVPMILRLGQRQGKSTMRIGRTIRAYIAFILADFLRRKQVPSSRRAKNE